jgi:hypothetical protein
MGMVEIMVDFVKHGGNPRANHLCLIIVKLHLARSRINFSTLNTYRVSQNWRTNYLLPYRGCLNVHEQNMQKMFPTKKSIIFIIIINGNTM